MVTQPHPQNKKDQDGLAFYQWSQQRYYDEVKTVRFLINCILLA